MKGFYIFLLLTVCLISCAKTDTSTNISDQDSEIVGSKNQSDSESNQSITTKQINRTKTKIPVPEVSEFSQQPFFRLNDEKDIKKQELPPFTHGEISFFAKTRKVKVGDKVTAVPIEIDFENLTLKVKKVKKVRYLDCTEEKTGSDFEFEKIVDEKLLEMPPVAGNPNYQPLDFVLIYPAAANARKLKQTELTKEMLPENIEIKTVIAAIDLNDDGEPDLLINYYCCYFSSQCDCTENYRKIKGKWKMEGMSEPC